jgi:acetyl-CoA carboxylase biotin carboxyl carrier protein
VLDPAGPREVLGELGVRAPDELGLAVEDEAGGAGGALVDGEDHGRVSCPLPSERRSGGTVPDVEAHITGTVWKIEVEVGDAVEEGDTVVILESMKMEMPVEAEDSGTVKEIRCSEGQAVSEGETLVVLE